MTPGEFVTICDGTTNDNRRDKLLPVAKSGFRVINTVGHSAVRVRNMATGRETVRLLSQVRRRPEPDDTAPQPATRTGVFGLFSLRSLLHLRRPLQTPPFRRPRYLHLPTPRCRVHLRRLLSLRRRNYPRHHRRSPGRRDLSMARIPRTHSRHFAPSPSPYHLLCGILLN